MTIAVETFASNGVAIFTPDPPPSPGTEDKPEFKLLESEFGDGYTQSAPEGLNHIRRVLTLTWDLLLPAQSAAMMTFIRNRKGTDPFYYTPSDETDPVLWTCKDPRDKRLDNGFRSFSATFRQSFQLV